MDPDVTVNTCLLIHVYSGITSKSLDQKSLYVFLKNTCAQTVKLDARKKKIGTYMSTSMFE